MNPRKLIFDRRSMSNDCDSICTKEVNKSNVRITSFEPGTDFDLTSIIDQMDHANIAHVPQWYEVFSKAYGHTPLYLIAEDADNIGLLPAFLLKKPIFGTVVCSMPFLDSGGPCSSANYLSKILVDSLLERAEAAGASHVELRCTEPLDLSVPANKEKVSLVLQLPDDPEKLWQDLNAKVRNQVRKAMRSALTVEFGGIEKLDVFYKIFTVNMRNLGSPVHSYEFFSEIFAAFGDQANIDLVYKERFPIGGLIALTFKDTLIVPWASCLPEYFPLCPNMILYWETIRKACEEGYKKFDFGRSSRNSGTYRFKRQWGALEEQLYWYTIPITAKPGKKLSTTGSTGKMLTSIWKHLPLGVSTWLGSRIRKYLTQ